MSRKSAVRARLSLAVSVLLHGSALAFLAGHQVAAPRPLEFAEVELVELPEPEPPPEPEPVPEPEPEPEPAPEPPPRPVPDEPPPPTPKAAPPAPPAEEPVVDEPPPRFELPPDQVLRGSNSGVSVAVGSSRGDVAEGTPDGKGKARRPQTPAPSGEGPPGPTWAPRSEIYIRRLPEPLEIPELRCPAVREEGVTGTVVLTVQVQRDGTVRRVRIVSGIGRGCNEVARKALLQARFAPAVATDGRPADYELRYEYVFELDE